MDQTIRVVYIIPPLRPLSFFQPLRIPIFRQSRYPFIFPLFFNISFSRFEDFADTSSVCGKDNVMIIIKTILLQILAEDTCRDYRLSIYPVLPKAAFP